MTHSRCFAAAIAAFFITIVSVSSASGAPRIGFAPVPLPPTIDIPFPPMPVGKLGCVSGIVYGNFTDFDQNDDTLRVFGITANEVPSTEYPAVRAWDTFMVVLPGEWNHVNLVAYDEDGQRSVHRSVYMMGDGSCRDW